MLKKRPLGLGNPVVVDMVLVVVLMEDVVLELVVLVLIEEVEDFVVVIIELVVLDVDVIVVVAVPERISNKKFIFLSFSCLEYIGNNMHFETRMRIQLRSSWLLSNLILHIVHMHPLGH